MKSDLCHYQGEDFILWCEGDLNHAIVRIVEELGVTPDYGRGTDAYRALLIGLRVQDGQLYLDRIRVTTVGGQYPTIGGVAPIFPFDPPRFAIYDSLNIPIRTSGRLTLLKDQKHWENCVSGWFTPSHFAVNIDLEFVAGLLLDPTDDPVELLNQRNRTTLQVIDPIPRTNWKELKMFMQHDVTLERPPEFVRDALTGCSKTLAN